MSQNPHFPTTGLHVHRAAKFQMILNSCYLPSASFKCIKFTKEEEP